MKQFLFLPLLRAGTGLLWITSALLMQVWECLLLIHHSALRSSQSLVHVLQSKPQAAGGNWVQQNRYMLILAACSASLGRWCCSCTKQAPLMLWFQEPFGLAAVERSSLLPLPHSCSFCVFGLFSCGLGSHMGNQSREMSWGKAQLALRRKGLGLASPSSDPCAWLCSSSCPASFPPGQA